MTNTCTSCSHSFQTTESDLEFYRQLQVDPPQWCTPCRQRRRLSFRNERNLYKRSCDFTKKSIISIFAPTSEHTIYSPDIWWSDKWNPFDYGRDYDFSRGFFEQFAELFKAVPALPLMMFNCENSEYTNQSYGNKNCYMTITTDLSEDCYYTDHSFSCKDCTDCADCELCELCYESIGCTKCYTAFFSQDCMNCSDIYFSRNCVGSSHCFGCIGLRNKEYYLFNEPIGKTRWEKEVAPLLEFSQTTIEEHRKKIHELFLKLPRPYATIIGSENCTGDYLKFSKNAQNCFNCTKLEDCKNCTLICTTTKNCHDVDGGAGELFYECFSVGPGYNNAFCGWCWNNVSNLRYCFFCMNNSKDLFGCVGLKQAQYCIFNKQYSKEEYEKMVAKIITQMKQRGEWGEFFSMSMSPFGYNETVAQEFFPATKESCTAAGWRWKDEEARAAIAATTQIPPTIKSVPDSITSEIFVCKQCGKNYRVIQKELAFYRKMNLPIPLACGECRYTNRSQLRNPRYLWNRECDSCKKMIRSSYSPERPEIVYCESCYRLLP